MNTSSLHAPMHPHPHKVYLLILSLSLCLLTGCASQIKRLPKQADIHVPKHWQSNADKTPSNAIDHQVQNGWLDSFKDAELSKYSQIALQNNPNLLRSSAQLKSAIAQTRIIGANIWPRLDTNARYTRTRTDRNGNEVRTRNATAGLDISWEADLWGKLTQRKKSAALNSLAQKELYRAAEFSLVANVARAWYNLKRNQLLVDIAEQELKSLNDTADLIDEGYRRGIRSALDVYLSRSDVQLQISSLRNSQNTYTESVRLFKTLLGTYPDTKLDFNKDLPQLDSQLPNTGLPAQLLTRRPDIKAQKYTYDAQIANAKAAQRDRYPSIRFSGSISDASERFSQLFDDNNLIRNLVAGVSQPVFAAGALSARAKQAVHQSEIAYATLFQTTLAAFQEVENALDREHTLVKQYAAQTKALEYSERALELALERYQAGLENYTTVLASQRRLFNSKRNAITIYNARLQNRINLHLALGGSFKQKDTIELKDLPTILNNE